MYLNITLLVIKDWKYYWGFNLSFHYLHMSLFSDCYILVQCVHMICFFTGVLYLPTEHTCTYICSFSRGIFYLHVPTELDVSSTEPP